MQIEAFMNQGQQMHQDDQTMRNLYRSEGARLLLTNPQAGTLLHQRLQMIDRLLENNVASIPNPERAVSEASIQPPPSSTRA